MMFTRPTGERSLLRIPLRNLVHFALRFQNPDAVKFATDFGLMLLAAAWAWFVSFSQVPHPASPLPFVLIVAGARTFVYLALGLHRTSWLHVSRYEAYWL